MEITIQILAITTLIFVFLWVFSLIPGYKFMKNIKIFEKMDISFLNRYPSLTIVVTACNEEETIENALNTILQNNYPNLEIIVVNDRSTDKTGDILNKLKNHNEKLKIINVKNLKEGWLGKVNALNEGYLNSSGEWVLFTDADVHFSENVLKKAISYTENNKIDHFTILPEPTASNFLLKVVYSAFGFVFISTTKAYNVGKNKTKEFVGCGAFNLVRKKAFDKTEKFDFLKMEVGDDVGIGLIMKKNGFKNDFTITFNEINLDWYKSLKEMFKGLQKNFYGVASGYNKLLGIIEILFMLFYSLTPILTVFLSFYYENFWIFGLLSYFCLIIATISGKLIFGFEILPGLMLPLGLIILALMLLNSLLHCETNNGIYWRGTFYNLKDLKNGEVVFNHLINKNKF